MRASTRLLLAATISLSTTAVQALTRDDCTFDEYIGAIDTTELQSLELSVAPAFRQSATVSCEIAKSYTGREKYRATVKEEGNSGGFEYRIYYSDLSGTMGSRPNEALTLAEYSKSWNFSCRSDRIEGKHFCLAITEGLAIAKDQQGYTILIGSDQYPGSEVLLKIDQNPPHRASKKSGFSAAQASTILAELKSGQVALTRYEQWPSRRDIDSEIPLGAIGEVLAYLDWALAVVSSR